MQRTSIGRSPVLEIGLLKLGHLLCLVYWLGADLGVFYSSYFVADDKLSSETRVTMGKLLFALDQAPRICMPLIFGFGAHLAARLGYWQLSDGGIVGVWALCLGWLSLVLTLHHRGHSERLAVLDYWLRVAVIVGLVGYAVQGLATGSVVTWLATKLLIFAVLVACGLLIRRFLGPFGPAFAAVAQGTPTAADNVAIRETFAKTRPFVVTIWAGLLANTLFGLHLL
ncbi:MAG: hypothetical protein AAF417_06625 [Pseudomonadota bacterium]